MTEELDEDVVFEKSPLFQYLHDVGHTDFETCPAAPRQEDDDGESGGGLTSGGKLSQKPHGGGLWRLTDALRRWSLINPEAGGRTVEQQLDAEFGRYSVRCILDQDVLLQEDVELIELLDPSVLTLTSSPSGAPSGVGAPPRPGLIATPSLWDVAGLVGLTAVLLGLCSVSGGLWSLAAAPWGVALLGWAGLRAVILWRRGIAQRAVHSRTVELQAVIQNSRSLTILSRKALRLVQETEVISRGFTLVSAAGSFRRAGLGAGPRGQQLIGLRKALYWMLRSAFRAARRATCHMLRTFPLNSEIDNVTNYVSAVPLKELGLGLGIEHVTEDEAQELTDDYSLPALKMLFQLWVAQSSECFRRLALLLSPGRFEESAEPKSEGDGLPPPALHRSIATVTEPLGHALAGCLGDVRRSYNFHRHFETQPRTPCSDRSGRVREACLELNTLHTSIRSLQLHLKALLSEMIILEDELEKLMVSSDPVTLTFEGFQDLSERLQQLQPHMQASAGCWEETVVQVERMLRRAGPSAVTPQEDLQHCDPPVTLQAPPPPSYPLILDRDPVPEELEWEAYVSESESEGEGQGSWCDLVSPEERERHRREREESGRVLSELKAVLGFRASEGERMKRKQLLFNDQAAVTLSAQRATPEPSPESDDEEGNRLAECILGNDEEGNRLAECILGNDEEGKGGRVTPEPLTEFSCGVEPEEQAVGGAWPEAGGGGAELYQCDGVPGEGQNGQDCFLKIRVPVVSVMDRLTEIHGSEALSFSSSLATQVAARSHALIAMSEQTFGDDDDEEEEEEEEEEQRDGQNAESDSNLNPAASRKL